MSVRYLLATVIINNYNYARYLRAAIDSVLCQSYEALEVIVVDDGSTDNSRDIILSYGEQVIPVFKQNGGQASALNAGLARSHGDFVIFLDSDDLLLPNIVARVAEVFRSCSHIIRVQYRMDIIDTQGALTGVHLPRSHSMLTRGDLRQQVLTSPDDLTWMATSGNAFAAQVLRQIFPIPEKPFWILADFYLSQVTPLFGPLEFLDQVGALYRVHGANHYIQASPSLNLEYIRQTITHWRDAHDSIKQFADVLELEGRPATADDILSVAYVANRMTSLKLEPQRHPLQSDSVGRLWRLGLVAALRRRDVFWPMKCFFGLWFTAMACAPRSIARWLAEQFFFPERRSLLNPILGNLHRSAARGG